MLKEENYSRQIIHSNNDLCHYYKNYMALVQQYLKFVTQRVSNVALL